jgi:serine/threonine-protein kinase
MTPCPARELLQRLLADELSDAEQEAAGAHVRACPPCQQTLETLTAIEASAPTVAPTAGLRPDPAGTATPTAERADTGALGEAELRRLRHLLRPDTPGPAVAAPARADWPLVPGYEVLGVLGKGGMGVVYKARQLRLNRLVALKLVRADAAAAPGQRPRFLVEGEVLARLQHPHVVQIHDVAFHQGQAYFALELVEGGSLAQKLGGKPLPVRAAAELVACLARAVQAAHEQHIIHRDLKPANVLLTADGVPKLTDFGLAKMADVDLKLTRTGEVFGTPAYMAPEQALGQAAQVGPLTDVYALGAILYETLTGRPPFLAATYQEVLQQVSGHEPVPPGRLQPGIPPDVQTITLKCLQKEPRRRYASAHELAEDLRRFLAHEPIWARPPSWWYQGAKFVRRHRGAALAAGLLLLALVGGLGAVIAVQTRANRALAAKNAELADEQAMVQARFELAQRAVATYHSGVSEDVLLKNDQFKELRTKLLREAAGFYGDLERLLEGQTDPKSRRLLAEGYFQLSRLTDRIGDKEEALAVHRKALAVRRELAAAAGADVEARLEVAQSLAAVGTLLDETGRLAAALAAFGEQRDLAAALAAESPTDAVSAALAESHYLFGRVLAEMFKSAEALREYQQARQLRQQLAEAHPADARLQSALAQSHHSVAAILQRTGRLDEALQEYEQARRLRQQLAEAHSADARLQSELAISHDSVGKLLSDVARQAEALAAFQKALAIRQQLADAYPAITNYQHDLASSQNLVAIVLTRLGKPAEALEVFQQGVTIQQKLVDANPTSTLFLSQLALLHNNIGAVFLDLGKPAEALGPFQKSVALQQKVVEASPSVTGFQADVAFTYGGIGTALARLGKPAEALEAFQKGLTIQQKLADANPTSASFQNQLARLQSHLGRAQARLRHFPEAFAALDQGVALRQKLDDAHPTMPVYSGNLAYSYAYRGWAHVQAGQPAEAASDLRRALELWARLKEPTPEARLERARALALLAALGQEAESGVSAAQVGELAEQAVAALREVVKGGWDVINVISELRESDFDALRPREDFQKLHQELEAKAAATPAPLEERPETQKK